MFTSRRRAAEEGVLAFLADGSDHVVPLLHLRHQFRDLLGRVLQVGVQGDDDFAAALLEGRQDRHVLAEIAVELHHLYLRVCRRPLLQDFQERSRVPSSVKMISNGLPRASALPGRAGRRGDGGFPPRCRPGLRRICRVFRTCDYLAGAHPESAPSTSDRRAYFLLLAITFFTASTTSPASSMVIFGKRGSDSIRSDA